MKYTVIGSTLGVLFVFSAISYSKTFVQTQDPKPKQPTTEIGQVSPGESSQPLTAASTATPGTNESASAPSTLKPGSAAEKFGNPVQPSHTYTATAYSLRGRTASGRPVSRGLIAADPRVLPLGSRVWVEAGSFSGEYVVADTGGAVKGRRIDIWTPSTSDARRFGRRAVKLTVLTLGGKRPKTKTVVTVPVAETSVKK